MTRFRLTVEYDGGPFMGWQRQHHGPSVQGAIEAAILRVTGEAATIFGCGRTDAGVHAVAQVAHVDLDRPIEPFRLMEATNSHLRPAPVAIVACAVAAPDFHARFDCTGRAYRYRIVNRRAPLTIDAGRAWLVHAPLDVPAMQRAAQSLVGRHDFTTFRSVRCQASSPVKTLDRLDVARRGDDVVIEAAARSFLHHQVRSMVGCLRLVGDGRWPEGRVAEALAARERTRLGLNAPPEGLTLVAATYAKVSAPLTPGTPYDDAATIVSTL
ncbi:MAG: tRNA pseudouridine(38-40) synthase TruA [Janthinobacterium lividum]